MRKSSLGRRSSTHIPVRVPSLGPSSSGQRTCSGGKKSGLMQPGYTQKFRRSQSEDRESYGGRPMPSSAVRSSSTGRGVVAMTPKTPRLTVHANLPTGSARAPRSQMQSTESNRRMSSFGATKRKDPRPISEKSFQQEALAKVQKYFDTHGSNVIGPGNSVRPMNTKLFVDMMDHLLKYFDSRIVITKSNYLDELPNLLRKLGYRSKVDKSWLVTVNTPHSWQHVIALLSWMVESIECMDAIDDPFEIMYPDNIPESEGVNEDDDDSIEINRELILHLKKSYQIVANSKDHDRDFYDADFYDAVDSEFIDKKIREQRCTDEDLEVLQNEIKLIQEDVDGETQRQNQQLEELEKLQAKCNAVQSDYQSIEAFIEQSKQFVDSTSLKVGMIEQEISVKRGILEKKQEELLKIQEKVKNQKISLDDKEKFLKEKQDLQRMITFQENSIREFEKSAFSVDLKLAENQRELEKLIVSYNKIIAEKVIVEPRLKNAEAKFSLLEKKENGSIDSINSHLKNLEEEYKNLLHDLKLRKEECENVLWRLKQDKKETEEEITKEKTLLEGLECDIENQEELINKESQKLKEELQMYQKKTREIRDEISEFDPEKLEQKKLELKKVEHDWELLQKKGKEFLEKYNAQAQERIKPLQEAIEKRYKAERELRLNHL